MTKILIVEDDPLISRMYQKMFTLDGYEVEVASDGQDGVDKARAGRPAIILMDVMMPRLNGLQALQLLKSDPSTSSVPVVMLTNLTGEQEAENALKNGAVKYIIKSEYEPKQVADIVKEILTKQPTPTLS